MNDFDQCIEKITGEYLHGLEIEALQVNLGLLCNQQCKHCHLECSPNRTEIMKWQTMELVIEAAQKINPKIIDITGGAPELNPNFKRFVIELRKKNHLIQERTNLTVFDEPGMESLPSFLAENKVQLVASMPCYLKENVNGQRGENVYDKSVDAIRRLNKIGYGRHPDLQLNLVYNPSGPFLPPTQSDLEINYREQLGEKFGIDFNRLITITNMPIGRFLKTLQKENSVDYYFKLLKESFNPQTVEGLMCRHQVSISWDGTLYDCDFNLALGLPVNHGMPSKIQKFDLKLLCHRKIVTGLHCFGCTAGHGSSCQGAII